MNIISYGKSAKENVQILENSFNINLPLDYKEFINLHN